MRRRRRQNSAQQLRIAPEAPRPSSPRHRFASWPALPRLCRPPARPSAQLPPSTAEPHRRCRARPPQSCSSNLVAKLLQQPHQPHHSHPLARPRFRLRFLSPAAFPIAVPCPVPDPVPCPALSPVFCPAVGPSPMHSAYACQRERKLSAPDTEDSEVSWFALNQLALCPLLDGKTVAAWLCPAPMPAPARPPVSISCATSMPTAAVIKRSGAEGVPKGAGRG